MLVLYVFLLFHAVFGDFNKKKVFYNLEEAEILFESFMRTYDRSYVNEAEINERFNIFKKNLIEINEFNRVNPYGSYAINRFADMTNEEVIEKYTGFAPADNGFCRELTDADLPPGNAPATYDLREKIKIQVKNQHSCGSCWTFSATGSVEAGYHLKYNTFVSLSEQQILDCNGTSCEVGGNPLVAMRYLIDVGGQESDSDYPYEDALNTCRFDINKVQAKLSDCLSFNLQNEDLIREAVYKYGALVAVLDSSSFSKYDGGVFKQCVNGQLNHAVLIVGYGTDQNGLDYWIIKNSWGEQWGENGYILLPRGENACNFMNRNLGVAIVA